MPGPEDHASHKPGQGDVGGGRNGPTAEDALGREQHSTEVVGAAVEDDRQQNEQPHRAEHASQCAHDRVDRFGQGIQRAAWEDRFGDLLGRDAEEEHHEYFVDQEVDGDVLAEDVEVVEVVVLAVVQEGPLPKFQEVELHHVVVDVEVDIGPHQPDNHAQDEGDGVFLQEGYVTSDPGPRTTLEPDARLCAARPRSATSLKRRRLYHHRQRCPQPRGWGRRAFRLSGQLLTNDTRTLPQSVSARPSTSSG